MLVGIKRIYDKREITDGKRILVDALWPRGVKRGTSNIDLWMKEVAPSTELRKWFAHDPSKWNEFKKKYMEELSKNEHVSKLLDLVKNEDVTLVYAARDTEHNNAVVIAEYIKQKLEEKK
ncbi:MAG: DUF488 domain-containing protein [Candidatus Micrarchaeia archaeon]|jgi:uncharacterized protein YeaO (DUF488 family)